jgi:hypothetical protein
MGVLLETEGLNAIDVFENTKIVSEGAPSPRHHIKWPRANIPLDWVAEIRGTRIA